MSVKDLGLIGGQIYSVIDFSSDAMNVDIMKRVRNFGDPGGSPYEYAEASYPIYVVSLTRVGGVTTVVLDRLLADDKQLKAGFRLVLTCPRKSSFDVEYAEIKSVTSGSTTTTFTYDNPGPNETYNRISDRDIIAAGIHSIKVDSTSQQPVADFHAHLAAAPLDSGVTISDLNGTYDIHFGGTPPTSLTAEGGATLSGSGSSYTLVVDSNDTLGLALNFAGVPSNGSFTLPTIIRNDHSAADYVRLDFKHVGAD